VCCSAVQGIGFMDSGARRQSKVSPCVAGHGSHERWNEQFRVQGSLNTRCRVLEVRLLRVLQRGAGCRVQGLKSN
jgi:hypothetical protein